MDDVEEFMEVATADPGPAGDYPLAKPVGLTAEEIMSGVSSTTRGGRKEKKPIEGKLSQYASLGSSGYTPTSSTIETLPPDCYNLSMTMEGSVVFVPQKLVTDDLLRLPDSRSDEVVAEVTRFWTLKDKFKKFGFAHKRGFLLFGPPGSGKTSTIAIITADMIKSGGLVILAEHPLVLAKALAQLRTVEPDRPVVVIMEDLDTIIHHFGESHVLSILDGEAQIENVVYIATTNYPENLDGRVTNRPSRFDRIVKIGMPNAEAREMYLKSKVGDLTVDGIDLVKETEGLSIAHLKELIVGHHCQGNPVRDVLSRLQRMKVLPKSGNEGSKIGL